MQRTQTEPLNVVSESTNTPLVASSFIKNQQFVAVSTASPARVALPLLLTFALSAPTLIGAGNLSQAQAAPFEVFAPAMPEDNSKIYVPPLVNSLISAPQRRTSEPLRLAQLPRLAQAQTNQPAAQPGENQPALTVPVTPGGAAQPAPVPGTGTGTGAATVAPPIAAPGEPAAGTPPTVITPPAGEAAEPAGPSLTDTMASGREIANVRVVGTRIIQTSTVLLQVQNTKQGGSYAPAQTAQDVLRIEKLGFFNDVKVQVTPNLDNNNKVDVAFVVIENRVITCFKFPGITAIGQAELEKVLQSTQGSVMNLQVIDQDIEKIQALYRERGYAALVTAVEQSEDGCVTFTLQEGKICTVKIEGNKKTKEKLIRQQILTKTGGAFDENTLRKDVGRIYDMGFFEDVTYKIDDDQETPGCLIVTILVKERRTGSFSLGVGFDSRSHITGFIGLSESNFRGSGKRVSAQVEAGGQQSFDLSLSNPFLNSKGAAIDVNVFDRKVYREPRSVQLLVPTATTTYSFQEQRQGGRLSYSHPLNVNRDKTLIFGYRNEKVRLFQTDNDGTNTPLNLPADTTGRTSGFSMGFLRDRRDLRTDPSSGGREQFLVEKGVSFLGGTANFTKLDVDLRRYFPLMKPEKKGLLPKLVLAGRLVIGHSFGQLPAFEQYFMGGSETVRGYDVDEQFGDNQIFGNLELRYRIQKKFQVVAFADAGSSYGGRFASSKSFDALVGFGGGLRLQTPIGPIRFDVGRGDRGVKTHFGIGSSF